MLLPRGFLVLAGALVLRATAIQAQEPPQQEPQQIVQQIVDTERAANKADHSQWIYLEESHKPREHTVAWVASTPHGEVRRTLQRDGQQLSTEQQRQQIDAFLHDPHAQNKDMEENRHDAQQVDDFLKLLPTAFVWTRTGTTANAIKLHFVPDPKFHPPTREARVFSGMTGDLVADISTHRIRSISGRLIHDVTFGGGLLGRLKQGSSFALDQEPVGGSIWELTGIRVHLDGNALLFKSVSLQEDAERAHFKPEPESVDLDQAARVVMQLPEDARTQQTTASMQESRR